MIGGGTADLVGTTVTDAGEIGNALVAEEGTVSATDSSFYGVRSVDVRASTLSMTRDQITAHEAGLVLHGGASAELRDSLIAPPPGGRIGADVITETESLPVTPSLTIIGSTLYANGPSRYRDARAILANSPIQARIVNTILRANGAGPGGDVSDIETGGEGTWSVTNSVYTTVFGGGLPAPGSGTDIAAVPVFAGQETGNYQLTPADSALLDRGDPAQVIAGETELAGQPRVLAAACDGAPDIGAYELVRTDLCPGRSLGGTTSLPQKPVTPTVLGDETPARPVLSGVRVKQRRQGPTLEFRLSEPGTVSVTISKAASHGAGKGKRTSYRSFARFTQDASMGRSVIPLGPHLGTAKPTPDRYRLTVIATAGGLRSARHTVSAFKFAAP